jgi:hypothetical protein
VVVCHGINIPRLFDERASVGRACFSHSERRKKTQSFRAPEGPDRKTSVERLASVMTRGIKPST